MIGVSFKPNVHDYRNSPAGAVLPGLAERGAEIRYHDPNVPTFPDESGITHEGVPLDSLLSWADVVLVRVAHAAVDWDEVYARAALVVDTVNTSRGRSTTPGQVRKLGAGQVQAMRAHDG